LPLNVSKREATLASSIGKPLHLKTTASTETYYGEYNNLLLEDCLVHYLGRVLVKVERLDTHSLLKLAESFQVRGYQLGVLTVLENKVATNGSTLVDDIAIIILEKERDAQLFLSFATGQLEGIDSRDTEPGQMAE
jgi:hypothetical protein